jgi:hypothetical protein
VCPAYRALLELAELPAARRERRRRRSRRPASVNAENRVADDLVPILVVLGAVLGVWAFNRFTGSRPGRRSRRAPSDRNPR